MIKEWHSFRCLYTVIKILNPAQLCVEDRQVFQIFVFFWRYSDHYFLLDLGNRDRIRNKNLITATFISIFDGKLILNSWSSLLPLGTSVTWLTKIRILKNRNLRRKADRSFRGNSLKNHFRHLNLYSNPQSWWLEVVVIWAPLERQKVELHIFAFLILLPGSSPLKNAEFHENRYLFLILALTSCSGLPRNRKFGLFSMGKKSI